VSAESLRAGSDPSRATGRVYLVGAGPGDPGLMSSRARELVASADVILHDRLIPAEALDGARADAELRYVGKEGGAGGERSVPQSQTEELMIERALAGRTVVRLKGGDPFVFGRGGEEAERLQEAGIPFEVVPGVTAGIAASAYAGIPVTFRGVASAVALVTAHEDPATDETKLDWRALAAFPGTLVFYMGVGALPAVTEALIEGGREPSEPAVVVESGTLPSQRTVTGTLETIARDAAAAEISPPAITVLGEVAALGERLSWFESHAHPLRGLTVTVTRARAQASELARSLRALGARVLQAPVIRVQPLPGPPLDPSPYDLVCVTSANGVEELFGRILAGGRDARALAGCTIAAIGPATARALESYGISADIVPQRFVAESLVEALTEALANRGGEPVRRALIARASEAREVLPRALREQGIEVDVLELYETVAEPLVEPVLRAAAESDYITFASSSTVRLFFEALGAGGALSRATRVVSIGPVTSETLRERGIEPHVEATRHDADGLLEAVLADAAERRAPAAAAG
jgi:uroporphyrinogen III methyltransferase / synthase